MGANRSTGTKVLCEPGQFLQYDYRKNKEPHEALYKGRLPMIKAVQWNIERGYQLDEIIATLKRHQADIICLQELDIDCERTNNRNVPQEIAEALGMNCVYVTEFVEFRSPKRKKRVQGGGVHGNAILSHYDMDPFLVPHSYHPVVWEKDGLKIGEPRRGERVGFGANIHVPGHTSPFRVCSLHLEVFCGINDRLRQFADIFDDAKKHLSQFPNQMIFGDLNTMAHGIARLSPFFCSDSLRYKSIGYSEAQWWQKHIFDHATNESCTKKGNSLDLSNPHFYDPFCSTKDTTLHSYMGCYRGKLDWTLMRGFHVLAKGMDNHDFSASDHKLLYVVVRACSGKSAKELEQDIEQAYRDGRVLTNHSRHYYKSLTRSFLIALIFIYLAHYILLLIS